MAVKIYKNKDEANEEGIILNKIKKITQEALHHIMELKN